MVKSSSSQTIFANMPSRLYPRDPAVQWPVTLILPTLDFIQLQRIDAYDLATTSVYPVKIAVPVKKRQTKKVTACPHANRKHYAKNMCNHCYHRFGRGASAWNCSHEDRKMYAKGKC
jgi:hypothetical protein